MREIRSFRMTPLFNIANGMAVQERVNVEKARYLGVNIVK